ncbi:hypothetical protein BKA67DRAFT_665601 [Truncatella angustata]|uniref:Hpc2-related domain-containing protein n=1 Tax=Truncatella angustata TaxID=152316 RepID=A0A9P8RHG2_9PEZI|nr:uncharacterized protein BKA67DRAFT_665601 [Truncatella angustata]KAH6638655.1 hypothetical protein BKA67DRAFT_665601 [Truncatella angustata]
MRYASSSPELSDPPSGLSETTSPTHYARRRSGGELDEIVVDHSSYRYDVSGQPVLTKDGVPRRKPGPKPGTKLGKRNSSHNPEGSDAGKVRKPRKPRDPNAPPVQRKRKLPTSDAEAPEPHVEARSTSIGAGPPRQTKITEMAITTGRLEPMAQPLKRENSTNQPRVSNMSSLLNADPEPQSPAHASPAPPRPSGSSYDPIRSSYDPVRGTMVTPSYSNPLASPRAPTNIINRASASPSIASLVDPPSQSIISPIPTHTTFAQSVTHQSQTPRQEPTSIPNSPQPFRQPKEFAPPPAPKPTPPEMKKHALPNVTKAQIEIRPQSITSIAAHSKRTPPKNQASPPLGAQKNGLELPGDERSILDFGKSAPGELDTPSIVLHIPLSSETNKYVNFMRMAEDRYGWDALHPRQAEAKARKARIAAAAKELAQQDSGRTSGDEMSVDESDNDDSNVEMGGVTSGADKPDGKIKKKKRHFKEDEYDRDDDFVDDSEMLWEEQAAASRDGFFVYSGPLVPEVEKPEPGRGEGRPARGRGSRGGRGGSGRGTGTGRGRGGGPGSRGGVVRKPRMTKADKAQMDREKAEREAAFLKSTNGGGNYNVLHPTSPQFAGL